MENWWSKLQAFVEKTCGVDINLYEEQQITEKQWDEYISSFIHTAVKVKKGQEGENYSPGSMNTAVSAIDTVLHLGIRNNKDQFPLISTALHGRFDRKFIFTFV